MTINIQTDEKKKDPKKADVAPTKTPTAEELVPRSQIDEIVAKELARLEKRLRKERQKEGGQTGDKIAIKRYLDKTRITDEKFILRLIKWQITVELATYLQNKDAELSRHKLWEFLRKEYKHKKK